MKMDWQFEKLGDICEITMGQSPDGKSYNSIGNGVPLINGPVEFSDDPFGKTLRSKFTTQPTKFCKEGDLILCVRGSTTGRMNIAGFDACIGRGVAAIRAKQYQPWVNHFISSKRNEIHGKGTGATFPNVSGTMLANIELLMPPIPEQQRIVAILDEAFEAIAAARANAEQNRQNARALFESYLQSVFRQRGEGWVEKPLCEVATILNGYAFKSSDFSSNGPTKSIKITNVGVREFVETSDNGLPAGFSEKLKSFAVPADSLVIALTRTIIADGLKVAVVPLSYDGALVNQRVAALLPITELASTSYLFAYLSTSIVLNYVKEKVNTLMQPNLSITDLRMMPIPLPPEHIRDSIVDKLSSLEDATQRLESLYQRKIAALDELKQSLLQQAFSGQLDTVRQETLTQ